MIIYAKYYEGAFLGFYSKLVNKDGVIEALCYFLSQLKGCFI